MTQPRYPRRAVPTGVSTILRWEQASPDAPVIVRLRNGKSGSSFWNSIDKVLQYKKAVEVFDHLPAEEEPAAKKPLVYEAMTYAPPAEEVSYGAREPDGTRTVIVGDAGQKRYPRRAVNAATPSWTAEQLSDGADWQVYLHGSPVEANRVSAIGGDNLIRDGVWRETFAHHPAPVSDSDWQPFDGEFKAGVEYRCKDGVIVVYRQHEETYSSEFPFAAESEFGMMHYNAKGLASIGLDDWTLTHQRPAPAPQPSPQGEVSGTPTCERFTIRWVNEGTYCGYKVNIPNYEGGEVVTAKCFDRTVAELRAEVERLKWRLLIESHESAARNARGNHLEKRAEAATKTLREAKRIVENAIKEPTT